MAEYDAALRKLAVHCEFGNTLQDTLRDRFVCGLRHESIQQRLLSEKGLTYHKALEVARGMELADNETKAFRMPDSAVIKKLGTRSNSQKTNEPRTYACFRCGRSNHTPATCKFKDAQCHSCGKTGHIATVCRSRASQPKQAGQKTHRIQDDQQSSDESDGDLF